MSFRFSLQKIVDLKGNLKTQAEWMLSESLGNLQREQMSLIRLMEEKAIQQDHLAKSADQPIPITEIRLLQQYIDHLERLIERKNADVSTAKTDVDVKQQTLFDRTTDEKVWQKAREKAYRSFQALMSKKEQVSLDEMVSSRQGRETF